MTNQDMVKRVDPEKAKTTTAEGAREKRAETSPRAGIPPEQFPPSEDPLDSNQLKPMINARKHAGLKSE